MWKSSPGALLTVRPSTFFFGLHYFCASRRVQRKLILEAETGQYQLGGRSGATLMFCFGSVISNQRPEVFHPLAKVWINALTGVAHDTCRIALRWVGAY